MGAFEFHFGWRTALLGAAAVQCLLLALALALEGGNRTANRMLAAALVVLAGLLTPYVIGFAGFYDAFRWLTFAPFAVPLALGPLLYGYAHALADGRAPADMGRHLAAPAAQFAYFALCFLLPMEAKWGWYTGGHRDLVEPVFDVLAPLSLAAYAFAIGRVLARHRTRIAEARSDDDRFSARWLTRVRAAILIGLGVELSFWTWSAVTGGIDFFQQTGLYLALGVLGVYLGVEGWRHAALPPPLAGLEPDPEPEPVRSPPDWAAVAADIDARVREAGWWREPDLDVARLARRLGTNTGRVSRAINHGLGVNFFGLHQRPARRGGRRSPEGRAPGRSAGPGARHGLRLQGQLQPRLPRPVRRVPLRLPRRGRLKSRLFRGRRGFEARESLRRSRIAASSHEASMTDLNRRTLLSLSAGLAATAIWPTGARAAEDVLTEDWSGDVAVLREAWETLHPGLYRYSTPDEVSARLDALVRDWAAPGSFRSRFLALTRVTASIRCGHTYPSPYNGGSVVRDRLYQGRELVPFRFVWIDGEMVVTHDDSAERLFPRGSRIVAVNGVATQDLLARLTPLARADGASDAKRVSLMEVRGDDGYETFDIHLPLVLPGIRDTGVFTLAGGRTVHAGLLTLAERRAAMPGGAETAPDANPWTFTQGADGVGRLTMPGWALYNSSFDWRGWLGRTMDELTAGDARGLIVDLRGNEGGLDCGDVILSRLIDRDLTQERTQRFLKYRRVPDALRPHLSTWDPAFYDWGDAVTGPDARGYFTRLDGAGEATTLKPEGRRYGGRVCVLCDASNSSATFGFAETVQRNGLATLVGVPTGGNRRGINGGAFFFLKLPASQVVVDLPLIASFPSTPQPDAPVEPDVLVRPTAEDIAAGRDPQMAAAIRLLLNP